MIPRATDVRYVEAALKRAPVVALIGPRQCGKAAPARQSVPVDSLNYFDLEDPQSLARLSEPDTALRPLKGLVALVKAPKVYVRDTGLLHALLGVATQRDLEHHPKVGASWEATPSRKC